MSFFFFPPLLFPGHLNVPFCVFLLHFFFSPASADPRDLRFRSALSPGGDGGDGGELLTQENRPAILLRGLFASRLGRQTQEAVTITNSHGAAAVASKQFSRM